MPSLPFDKLNESNYHDWKIQMEALLEEKGLFGVVNGRDTRPSGPPTLKQVKTFLEKQRVARAKIILTVEPSQLPHVWDTTDLAIIWRKLGHIHHACGLGILLTMRMDFFKRSMPLNSTVASWITKVRHAAYRLEECYCAEEDLTTDVSDPLTPHSSPPPVVSDLDKIGVLLNGLPTSYQAIVVNITGIPLLSLNFEDVVTHLMNEEGRQWNFLLPVSAKPSRAPSPSTSETQSLGPENVAMVARPTSKYVSHIRNSTSASKSALATSQLKCHKCGGVGHFRRQCPTPDSEGNAAALEDDDDVATTAIEDFDTVW